MSKTGEHDAAPPDIGSLVRRGVAWRLTSQGLTQIVRLVVTFVLARFLAPSEYGIASLALLVTGFVFVFSDLSLGAAIVQRTTISERDLATMFWVTLAAGTLFTLTGIAASGLVADIFDEPTLQGLFAVMSLTFLITSLGATQQAVLTRSMSFRQLELRMIVGTLVGGVIGVALAVAGAGPWAIIGQQVSVSAVSTILLWLTCPWRPSFRFSWRSVRELGGFSGKVMGNRLLYVADSTLTTGLIGKILGPQSLGLYVVANNVVQVPLSGVVFPLADVFFPAFSRLQDDKHRIGAMWLSSLPYAVGMAAPALLGLAVVAPDFVAVALGSKWSGLTPVLQVLAIYGVVRAVQGLNTPIIMATGRVTFLVQISVWSLVVGVAAVVIGSFAGVIGVSVSLAISGTLLVGLPVLWYVGRVVGVTLLDIGRALSGVLQASVIMALVVFGVRQALLELGVGVIARLTTSILVGCAVYAVACHWRAPVVFDRGMGVVARRVRLALGRRPVGDGHAEP
jgi:O-antigen/teichoic acid export membrane protein